MEQFIVEKIESKIKKKVLGHNSLFGGCISSAFKLRLEDGNDLFCKISSLNSDMFYCEKSGLEKLGQALKVPRVIDCDDQFILMEYIQPGTLKLKTFYNFGKNLARLHKITCKSFGLSKNNYIGLNPQINTQMSTWVDFYFENRLKFQYKLAESKNNLNQKIKQGFLLLEKRLHKIIEDKGPPSLIHGDLWSGNLLIDMDSEIVLIDPAVYFGHREAEFGMVTLFGNFLSPDFYLGYNEVFPLQEGWLERNKIYQLYHLFNHLNLFGKSYSNQIVQILDYFS